MDIINFLQQLPDPFLPLIKILLCALLGYLGLRARAWLARRIGDSENREKEAAAYTAVRATEQLCRNLHGTEKLDSALACMNELLAARGISVAADEATWLLEAAVADLNRALTAAA